VLDQLKFVEELKRKVKSMKEHAIKYPRSLKILIDLVRSPLPSANEVYALLEDFKFSSALPTDEWGFWNISPPIETKTEYQPLSEVSVEFLQEACSDSTAVAVDSSWIEPDPHIDPPFALLNIGSFYVSYERGEYIEDSIPILRIGDEVYVEKRGSKYLMSPADIDAWSFSEECRIAKSYFSGEEMFVFFDRSFSLSYLGSRAREDRENMLSLVAAKFLEMRSLNLVPIAVYFTRSRSVVNTLTRIYCSRETCSSCVHKLCKTTLEDKILMANILEPGERSPIFIENNSVLKRSTLSGKVAFFYLNTGYSVLRVEFPSWVMKSETLVRKIHRFTLAQALMCKGYPYIMARAHEKAVLRPEEREFIREKISSIVYRGTGARYFYSSKALAKRRSIV